SLSFKEYLIIGGTGFISSYIINSILEQGHIVRRTAQNPNEKKVGFLWELEGGAKERLKIFEADLTIEGKV
ncbi:unnamed protein product, partial [Brassica oleracea var. botrytis]